MARSIEREYYQEDPIMNTFIQPKGEVVADNLTW